MLNDYWEQEDIVASLNRTNESIIKRLEREKEEAIAEKESAIAEKDEAIEEIRRLKEQIKQQSFHATL